jgi:hypothetical protein
MNILYHEAYDVAMKLKLIDDILDKNEVNLSRIVSPLADIEELKKILQTTKIEKEYEPLLNSICVDCYINEYNEQLQKANNIQRQNIITDSIERLTDSINSLQIKNNTPENIELKGYDGFKIHLDGMSPYFLRGSVTPFIGVDYGFASTRFAIYIISNTDYTIDEECSYETESKIIHCFVPKIQMGNTNEQLKITYTVVPDKTKIAYISENTCRILTNVSIEGNADIVLHIFMQYWQTKVHSSKNIGVMATWQFMGDFISLKRINKGVLRIDIIKNPNIQMNYYQMFDIK